MSERTRATFLYFRTRFSVIFMCHHQLSYIMFESIQYRGSKQKQLKLILPLCCVFVKFSIRWWLLPLLNLRSHSDATDEYLEMCEYVLNGTRKNSELVVKIYGHRCGFGVVNVLENMKRKTAIIQIQTHKRRMQDRDRKWKCE